jgi:hypothetical protein
VRKIFWYALLSSALLGGACRKSDTAKADRMVPSDRAARVTAQVLVIDGGASKEVMPFMQVTAEQLTKAIPGARHQTLEGQGHAADDKVLAPVLRKFLGEENSRPCWIRIPLAAEPVAAA